MISDVYQALGISLGLGLLVGLQRQWKASEIAGIRTFPLFTLLGTVTTLLAETYGGWLPAAGLLSVAWMLHVANRAKLQSGQADPGLTTEMAALVMFAVGCMLGAAMTGPAIAVGGAVAVLLHWKQELHRFVGRIGENELRGITHLVLIALVILPVLPNQAFDRYGVLNPYKIWWVVVLIVSISLTAYVAYKLLGARAGSVIGGVLGGLISSTATTVSYARQAHINPAATQASALVILIASTVVNGRILFEISVVAPEFAQLAAGPLLVMLGFMGLLCAGLFLVVGHSPIGNPLHDNPTQLRAALVFAGLYALILVTVAAVRERFGTEALYGIAALSGLTDVDAITLSTAEMVKTGRIDAALGWRLVLVASLSNLAFKGAMATFLGGRRLGLLIGLLFGLSIALGMALLVGWDKLAVRGWPVFGP